MRFFHAKEAKVLTKWGKRVLANSALWVCCANRAKAALAVGFSSKGIYTHATPSGSVGKPKSWLLIYTIPMGPGEIWLNCIEHLFP